MTLTRKDFVARSGLALGAAALVGCRSSAAASAPPASPGDWDGVRAQFDLRRDVHHFAAFVLATHPRAVREAIERHRRGLDEDPFGYLHGNQGALEDAVRDEAASYLGGRAEELALTDSTTMGLGLLYGGLKLKAGDEILTTEHDFFSTHDALRLRALRTGRRVRRIALYRRLDRVSADEIVESVVRALRPRTRIVAVTWVHSSTGLKLPIRRIAEAIGGRALLCVDGVHGVGVEDAGVGDLGADFLVAGCHKWLHGPRGTGIVWGRADEWRRTQATVPSFDDGPPFRVWSEGRIAATPGSAFAMTPGGYHSFEHRWALAEAFRFHREIGRARVAARVHELAGRLKQGLAALPNVTLVTPLADELSAGIVCLEVKGLSAHDAVEGLLERRVVASVTPYATEYVRLGAGLTTGPEDVDAAIAAVKALS